VSGFKAFLMRGNLISLAVAVVIGTAFTAVVTALVADIITPLIAAIAGQPNFGSLTFTVHHSKFSYGLFINALLSFVIIASVVYWLIVAPTVALTARLTRKADVTTKDCPECLSTIPIAATRCMYCTVELPAPATAQAPGPTAGGFTTGQAPRSTGRHSSGN
jgi:large conductance mechanosensitive channel